MYKIKQLPEDFVVKEIPLADMKPEGKYLYFLMKKKGRNTLDVIQELARRLHLREKDIGFAGSKDRYAVTEQMISIIGAKKENIENLKMGDVSLEFQGLGKVPVSLGDLQENEFEIVVRNLEGKKISRVDFLENYFGEQRFSLHNADIGKHIIKKEFRQAVGLIDDAKINGFLKEHLGDFVGALKRLPIRMLRMYINAYQSYIWNETAARYLDKKGKSMKKVPYSGGEWVFVSNSRDFKDLKIPIVGFGYECADEEIRSITEEIMKEERLSPSDFIIKQIPELTLEGELRKAVVPVQNLKIGRRAKDELNPGMMKVKISFALPKGSYATIAIEKIISQDTLTLS
ncbi:MAG: tRNA pseudouridine(13) synthase TruD [Nanoarchaeota archaeon]